jgi:hypothetical protein
MNALSQRRHVEWCWRESECGGAYMYVLGENIVNLGKKMQTNFNDFSFIDTQRQGTTVFNLIRKTLFAFTTLYV